MWTSQYRTSRNGLTGSLPPIITVPGSTSWLLPIGGRDQNSEITNMPPAVEFPEIHEFGGLGGFGGEIPKSLIPTPEIPPPGNTPKFTKFTNLEVLGGNPEIHEILNFGVGKRKFLELICGLTVGDLRKKPSGDKKKGLPRNFFVLKSSAFGRLDYDTEAS